MSRLAAKTLAWCSTCPYSESQRTTSWSPHRKPPGYAKRWIRECPSSCARVKLVPELEPTLRRMGERGDIIKTMHRELKVMCAWRRECDLARSAAYGQVSRNGAAVRLWSGCR